MQELAIAPSIRQAVPAVSLEQEAVALEREFETRLADSSGLAFRVARGVLRNSADAEEVAQEAFLKAYRSFRELRDREKFRGWLVRITFRLALDRATHLPIRSEVFVRNVETRERTELVKYYSNYHAQQGVQTPFQEAHERDGRRIYQVFYNGCAYNTGLSEDLFTRASLEKHYAEFGKKKKK